MIRQLSKEDIDCVLKIEKENFNNPWIKDQFIRCYKQPLIFLSYVYCRSYRVIGYFISEIIIDEVHLHKIAVGKKYQNNKVGLKLIKHLIKQSQFLDKQKICLEVDSINIPALKLYNNLGFSMVGERKEYYNNNNNAILMDLIL